MAKRHYSRSKTIFKVNDQEVRGDTYKPRKAKQGGFPAVMFLHGRDQDRDSYTDIAKQLADKYIASFVFDFRGHGDSKGVLGKQTLRDGLKDGREAYDILLEEDDINHKKIGIFGFGFGGYLASLLSDEREIKSMLLTAPAIYKDEWLDLMYRNFPLKDVKGFRSKINFVEMESIKAIRKYTGRLMIAGTEDDKEAPETFVNAYYANAIKSKKKKQKFFKLIDNKLKNKEFKEKFEPFVVKWFSKTL